LISVDQEETIIIVPIIIENKEEIQIEKNRQKKIYVCKFCDKTFNHCQGRWSHEKICKHKNDIFVNIHEKVEKTNSNYRIMQENESKWIKKPEGKN
jgi:hypothetical protein